MHENLRHVEGVFVHQPFENVPADLAVGAFTDGGLDVGPQALPQEVQRVGVFVGARKLVVQVRQDFLLELDHREANFDGFAGQVGVAVVFGQRDRDFPFLAFHHPDDPLLDLRQHLPGAHFQHRVGAVDGGNVGALKGALIGGDDEIVLAHRPAAHRAQLCMALAQLLHRLLELLVGNRWDVPGEGPGTVIGQLDAGDDLGGGHELEGAVFGQVDVVDLRFADRLQVLLRHGLGERFGDQLLQDFLLDALAVVSFQYGPGHLALPEAGDFDALLKPSVDRVHLSLDPLNRHFDRQAPFAGVCLLDLNFHRLFPRHHISKTSAGDPLSPGGRGLG